MSSAMSSFIRKNRLRLFSDKISEMTLKVDQGYLLLFFVLVLAVIHNNNTAGIMLGPSTMHCGKQWHLLSLTQLVSLLVQLWII